MGKRALAGLLLLNVAAAALAQVPDGGSPPPAQVPPEALPRPELAPPREEVPPGVREAEGERILGIRVVGNRRVEEATIRRALTQAPGDVFRPARATEDLRRLYALGQFSDIELSVERLPEGIIYEVRVEERPVVRDVLPPDTDRIREEELQEAIAVRPGTVLDPDAVRRSARAIERAYEERGHAWAQVSWRLAPVSGQEGQVDLAFTVDEGPRVRVAKIDLAGVRPAWRAELRAALPLRRAILLWQLTGIGVFREADVERALEAIRSFYFDRGFIDARVESQVVPSRDRRSVSVTFRVTEGERYRFGEVRLTGEEVVPFERMRERLTSREGEVFDRSAMLRDVAALTSLLADMGYACARVTPLVDVGPASRTAGVRLEIRAGERVRVGRIEITGNTRTRDRVIRRELVVEEGEPFSGEAVRRSAERLRALGIFQMVDVSVTGCEGGRADVRVAVEEAQTGAYQLSVGFVSSEGLVGTGRVVERNLFGTGRAVSAVGQLSEPRRSLEGSLIEPYLLGSRLDLALDLYANELEYPDFSRQAYGGRLGLTFLPGRTWPRLEPIGAGVEYTLQVVAVPEGSTPVDPSLLGALEGGRISSLRLTASYDDREGGPLPTRGTLASGSVEVSPGALGATLRFARYLASVHRSSPLPGGLVLRLGGSLGYLQSLGPGPPPISERFFVGGFATVRGYPIRSIAPTALVPDGDVPDATGEEVAVGGDKQLLFSAELDFPLPRRLGLRGVLFYDAGNAFAPGEPFFVDRQDGVPLGLFHAVGIGVRWLGPLGPLGLELAVPLNRRSGDPPVVLELSTGRIPRRL